MSTNGDYIRPLFPGLTLPDTTHVGLQRAIPVGPIGGMVRDALSHVKPAESFADDDWLTVTWDDTQTLADQPATTGIISDLFDGTALSSAWAVVGAAPTVSGGKVHFSNAYPQKMIRSVATHSFVGTTATILGLVAPAGSNNDAAKNRGMLLQDTSNPSANFLQFIKYGPNPGTLLCRTNPGTTVTFPYNAVNHANLRLRETGGQLFFETSSNATTWNLLRQVPLPTWATTAQVFIALYGGSTTVAYSDPQTESTIDKFTWA